MWKKLKSLLFIVILGSVSVALLIFVERLTAPIISYNEEIQFKSTLLDVAEIKLVDGETIDQTFLKKIRKEKKEDFVYFLTSNGSYVINFSGQGLWGPITGLLALKPDFETIEKLRILSQVETPGLGGRISEEEFLAQFNGKKISPKLVLVLRTKASKDNQVDAISGATLSSMALVDMVNLAAQDFKKVAYK